MFNIASYTPRLILILNAIIAFANDSISQSKSYRTFEWDIFRVGYAFASADNLNSGIALSSEPRINITDNFSAGVRWEVALFDVEEVQDVITNVNTDKESSNNISYTMGLS